MSSLRMLVARAPELLEGREFAALIMPCFAGPYHAYLHLNVSLRFMRCEPDLSALSGKAPAAVALSADLKLSPTPTSSPEVTLRLLLLVMRFLDSSTNFANAASICTSVHI